MAIGLPSNPEAAKVVLDLYHPNRIPGELFRMGAHSLIGLGLTRQVLKSEGGVEDEPLVPWLVEASSVKRRSRPARFPV